MLITQSPTSFRWLKRQKSPRYLHSTTQRQGYFSDALTRINDKYLKDTGYPLLQEGDFTQLPLLGPDEEIPHDHRRNIEHYYTGSLIYYGTAFKIGFGTAFRIALKTSLGTSYSLTYPTNSTLRYFSLTEPPDDLGSLILKSFPTSGVYWLQLPDNALRLNVQHPTDGDRIYHGLAGLVSHQERLIWVRNEFDDDPLSKIPPLNDELNLLGEFKINDMFQ